MGRGFLLKGLLRYAVANPECTLKIEDGKRFQSISFSTKNYSEITEATYINYIDNSYLALYCEGKKVFSLGLQHIGIDTICEISNECIESQDSYIKIECTNPINPIFLDQNVEIEIAIYENRKNKSEICPPNISPPQKQELLIPNPTPINYPEIDLGVDSWEEKLDDGEIILKARMLNENTIPISSLREFVAKSKKYRRVDILTVNHEFFFTIANENR